MKNFKPMLVCNEKVDIEKIQYPMLASTKLDGIRCIFINGEMLTRSLKQIPSKQLQKKFQNLKDYSKKNGVILDGELYGLKMSFQEITHFVMTEDLSQKGEVIPDKLKFFCFDELESNKNMIFKDIPFIDRYNRLIWIANNLKSDNLILVKQEVVKSSSDIESMFKKALDGGFEGLILKHEDSFYKFGRATFNFGDAYKIKPFLTFDGKVTGIEERFENTSESFTNELGGSSKHSYQADLKPTGIASTFIVQYLGQEQRVVITGDEAFRRKIWNNKKDYIGKIIEFKGMLVGSKDKVRHPTFIRFRNDKEDK